MKIKKIDFKKSKQSIQFRLFVAMCVSTMLAILLTIIVNTLISEKVYIYSKIKTILDTSKTINEYYNTTYTSDDLNKELRNIETKNSVTILIKNNEDETIYYGNKEIYEAVENEAKNFAHTTILKKGNTEIKSVQRGNSIPYIILISTLDNGYKLYIKVPISPLQENVKITNRTLAIVGIIMILISALVATFFSKKLAEPIIQLNRITKKMAGLDFSEKYSINPNNNSELNEIGHNINVMSTQLETTINTLRENNDELERDIEEKLKIDEMRKQFISDVSHELKTPIALIQGYSEGLIDNVNEDEESRKFYAEVIQDEAIKMDTMVKKLLELMKIEYKERKFNDTEFDLSKMINDEIKRETVRLKDKNIEVEFTEKKPIKVFADEDCIEQVINNFFTNAIKHCEEVKSEKKIIFRTEKKDNKIRLFVYNTGKKIPKENIKKIWGRFYKEDTSRNREDGGTGIGLALVKAIMNNYENEYGVKNYENGVEFYCDINLKSI